MSKRKQSGNKKPKSKSTQSNSSNVSPSNNQMLIGALQQVALNNMGIPPEKKSNNSSSTFQRIMVGSWHWIIVIALGLFLLMRYEYLLAPTKPYVQSISQLRAVPTEYTTAKYPDEFLFDADSEIPIQVENQMLREHNYELILLITSMNKDRFATALLAGEHLLDTEEK